MYATQLDSLNVEMNADHCALLCARFVPQKRDSLRFGTRAARQQNEPRNGPIIAKDAILHKS